MNNKGKIAIAQIMILIVGMVAVSYAIGSSIGFVEAALYPGEWDSLTNTFTGSSGGKFLFDLSTKTVSFSGKPVGTAKTYTINNIDPVKPVTDLPTGGSSWLSETLGIKEGTVEGGRGNFWSYQTGGLADAFFSGVQWYVASYYAITILGPMFGLEDNLIDAYAAAASWGLGTFKFTNVLFKGYFDTTWEANLYSGLIGVGFALYWYAHEYEEVFYRVIEYDCKPWRAADGGQNCELCNQQDLPCSEYQCKSLGKGCVLLNEEGSEEALCAWEDPTDVKPPVIQPNPDDLIQTEGYDYNFQNVGISPPDNGVEIIGPGEGGCVPPFTPLSFGIMLDEPAACKADYLRKDNIEEMNFDFGDSSTYKYNHTQIMNLPGPDNEEENELIIRNDGNYSVYVRCEDSNGNPNTANFVFKFCVEPGPDTTAPYVMETGLVNGMPVSYNQNSTFLVIYLNEPVDCKWSHNDEDYINMPEEFDCSNAQRIEDATETSKGEPAYSCTTTLKSIKNEEENDFYFRCRDQPWEDNVSDRNTMSESYLFTLIGTRPLYIDNAEPNETTVRDSTDEVKVTLTAETSAGFDEGRSICKYRESGTNNEPVEFFNTNSYTHSTDLYLIGGETGEAIEYEFDIICTDDGGNQDTEKIIFDVESDGNEPIVVRAYKETGYLKVVTDEAAECVYDTSSCGYLFEDGLAMSAGEENSHFTEWNTKTKFYVKCSDEYGNKPEPNECSAIIKPLEQ